MSVRLSVVMPVHDVAPWIEEQLDCVLRQDVDLELIVIDDRSSDETFAIVERIASGDPRVRLHRSRVAGGGAARNQGIDLAQGEYVVFADGDDLVPDGSYRALVDAADRGDAVIALGRHLKFSSGSTWEPMSSWYDVLEESVTDLETMPRLLANRACWNRVFRTEFVRAAGVRFPDVPRSNDIVPMVRAVLAADRIAVVPEVVYLYRERPGTSSMTARASGVDGVMSYFDQELEVASLLADTAPSVRAAHAEVVLAADGYVHLKRFLRGQPDAHDLDRVVRAVRDLLAALPTTDRATIRAERRALWFAVANGEGGLAVRLASALHDARDHHEATPTLLRAWADAVRSVGALGGSAVFSLDRASLVNDGPLVLLANRAEHTDVTVLRSAVADLGPEVQGIDGHSELLHAVAEAVRANDPLALQLVSAVRHLAPLVVDEAHPDTDGVSLTGPLVATVPDGASLEMVLTAVGTAEGPATAGAEVVFGLEHEAPRWSLRIANGDLATGRHRAAVRIAFRGLRLEFPVVTARMPLPPVMEGVQLQPLADRADGWRFLVDRRAGGVPLARRLLRAARARLRS
ncbi:glycosyltransferase family A protein [Curtobacterium sp. PhB115]|uniref:glycosyltransferase family 2 protein n=1 Tax=Curtobacterium sp. PhB115 TaxID=2485173 RepID=UPI000F4C4389|nr:glycosyltransferase family A protein [Curtobacterium sp. PhB115]ROP63993.1 glycosyl transferase family 2 [Curtobacterium sp. PhB115]